MASPSTSTASEATPRSLTSTDLENEYVNLARDETRVLDDIDLIEAVWEGTVKVPLSEHTGGWSPIAFDTLEDIGWKQTADEAGPFPPPSSDGGVPPNVQRLTFGVLGKDSANGAATGARMYNGLMRVAQNALFRVTVPEPLLPVAASIEGATQSYFPLIAFTIDAQRLFTNLPLTPGEVLWDGTARRAVFRVPDIPVETGSNIIEIAESDPRARAAGSQAMVHAVWEPLTTGRIWFVHSLGADPAWSWQLGGWAAAPFAQIPLIIQESAAIQIDKSRDIQVYRTVLEYQASLVLYRLMEACDRMLRITQEMFGSSRAIVGIHGSLPPATAWRGATASVGFELGHTTLATYQPGCDSVRWPLRVVYEESAYKDEIDNNPPDEVKEMPLSLYAARFVERCSVNGPHVHISRSEASDIGALILFMEAKARELPIQPYGVVAFDDSPFGRAWVMRAPSSTFGYALDADAGDARVSIESLPWTSDSYYCIGYFRDGVPIPLVRRARLIQRANTIAKNFSGVNHLEARLPSVLLAQFARFLRQRAVIDQYAVFCDQAATAVAGTWPDAVASHV